MFVLAAIVIWGIGLFFTSQAMATMGSDSPLLTALVMQIILTFGQNLLLNDTYKRLPSLKQKIVLGVGVIFLIFDVFLNFVGLDGYIGDVTLLFNEPVKVGALSEFLPQNQTFVDTLLQWFAAFCISVLPEILFSVGQKPSPRVKTVPMEVN